MNRPLPDSTLHSQHTSMPLARFKPTISARKWPQTHALTARPPVLALVFRHSLYCNILPYTGSRSESLVFSQFCRFYGALRLSCSEYCMQFLYFPVTRRMTFSGFIFTTESTNTCRVKRNTRRGSHPTALTTVLPQLRSFSQETV